jgi:hypothetical protein
VGDDSHKNLFLIQRKKAYTSEMMVNHANAVRKNFTPSITYSTVNLLHVSHD